MTDKTDTDPAENATERIREYMPQCSDKEIAHIIRTAYAERGKELFLLRTYYDHVMSEVVPSMRNTIQEQAKEIDRFKAKCADRHDLLEEICEVVDKWRA